MRKTLSTTFPVGDSLSVPITLDLNLSLIMVTMPVFLVLWYVLFFPDANNEIVDSGLKDFNVNCITFSLLLALFICWFEKLSAFG